VQSKLVGHFSGTHSIGQILLVREHQKDSITKFVLVQHSVQLISSVVDTLSIVRVNHENQTLSILVVVSPEGTNFILTSNVPYGEGNVLVFYCLHVEPNRGNGRNDCKCVCKRRQILSEFNPVGEIGNTARITATPYLHRALAYTK
jgi:hypothetical protein